MNKTNGSHGLAALLAFALCLGTAEATVFDAGLALKANMQGSPANPYTDANGGVWTYGRTTAVAGGTLSTLDKTDQDWGATIKGFSEWTALPTINVNIGDVAVPCANGLSDLNHTIAPGEIVLHPETPPQPNPYAIIRFIVPQTNVYDIAATFRDVSVGGGDGTAGIDVHVVVNGQDLSSALVSADGTGPLPSFTAKVRAIHLAAGDTIDFVVGPNGFYGNDGTAVLATITTHTPGQSDLINLDINGYNPYAPDTDPVPGMDKNYSGAGRVGETNDFWNRMSITHATFESLKAPSLKLADGVTNTTVSFSLSTVGGGTMNADFAGYLANPLLNDYVYVTEATYRFTLSGLVPNAAYDLYFYSQCGNGYMPGRFLINGTSYDSIYKWFPTSAGGDYAACLDITADGNGSITGDFSRADPNLPGLLNGLQIVGTFPVSHPETVNLDLNGYGPGDPPDAPAGAGDAYSGAARVGYAGEFWNRAAVKDWTVASITAPNLKLADGITNTTVRFSLSAGLGSLLGADRMPTDNLLNPLMDDCVYIFDNTSPTNRFTLSGLVPNATYDLYFYSHGGHTYYPGRFIINGVVCDSINQAFSSGAGGDYALCAGITADSTGSISGDFCRASPDIAATLDGLQIVGEFPRQHADIVNLDINGFKPTDPDPEPGPADVYSGAAVIGSAGDYWNQVTVPNATVSEFTVRHLTLTDGTNKSPVTFSMSKVGGGLLNSDRIPQELALNPLLDEYLFIENPGVTYQFTISGLVPNTPYDLYFYSSAGVLDRPGRFVIDGVAHDSVDAWFPTGRRGGDYAVCGGITADAGGLITGEFGQAFAGTDAVFNGLQIMGTIPQIPQGTLVRIQ